MTFYEVLWMGDSLNDAADLEEALACYGEVKPEGLAWSEVCGNPTYAPEIRRYRSFDAYLDNEDAVETIVVTAAMLEGVLGEDAGDGASGAD